MPALGESELAIVLRAIVDPLIAGLKQGEAAVGGFVTETKVALGELDAAGATVNKTFSGLFGGLGALAGIAAVGGIVAYLKSAVDASNRFNTAIREAANSVNNMGGHLDATHITDFMEKLAHGAALGIATTSELADGMQVLAMHCKDTAQLERAMSDAVELAAARHESFGTAVNQINRVLAGNATALLRAGVLTKEEAAALAKIKDPAERANAALEILERRTRNASAAISDGDKQWGLIRQTFEDVTLKLGSGLTPALMAVIGRTVDFKDVSKNLEPVLKTVAVAVALLADLCIRLIGILDHVASGIGHILAAGADALNGNLKGAKDQFGAFKDQMGALWDDLSANISVDADKIRMAVDKAFAKPLGTGPVNDDGSSQFSDNGAPASKSKGSHRSQREPNFNITAKEMTAEEYAAYMVGMTPKDYAAMSAAVQAHVKSVIEDKNGLSLHLAALDGIMPIYNMNIEVFTKLQRIVNNVAEGLQNFGGRVLKDLANKVGVGGALTEKKNAQGGFAGFSLNPMEMLVELIMKTKAFGDMMQMLAKALSPIVQVLNAVLGPALRMIGHVAIFLANIFIDVYNVFANILKFFGIHVQTLQHLTDGLQQASAPLISIVHDIPTLIELATGKASSVKASFTQAQHVAAPVQAAVQHVAAALHTAAAHVASTLSSAADQMSAKLNTGARSAADAIAKAANPTSTSHMNMTNHFHGDINGAGDVEKIGNELADAAQRNSRMRGYEMSRSAV